MRRIFILGPSHHVRLRKCALSICKKYETPLYDLKIDAGLVAELDATKEFSWMDMKTDEDEHSIEMQLPYIAKVMEDFKDQFTIVPVLVGSLSPESEQMYGKIFAPYLADPQNLFVISSDFCHWGSRFRYSYYDKSAGPIWKSIENLDKSVSCNWYFVNFIHHYTIFLSGNESYRNAESSSFYGLSSEVSKHYLRSSPDIRVLAIHS